MVTEYRWLLTGLCLLAGYAFGSFLTAEIVAHCMAGTSVRRLGTGQPSAINIARKLGKPAGAAVITGDVLKTILACWFCYRLAAPELEQAAILYGGLGTVLGHMWPLWFRGHGGHGAVVTCTWIALYLPVTGLLCCLAGGVVMAGTGRREWGAVLVSALAIPVSWLQFDGYSAGAMLLVTLLLVWKYRMELQAGKEKGEKS